MDKARIINKTPHDVVILAINGDEIKRFRPVGPTLRLNVEIKKVDMLGRIPITKTRWKEVQGLPIYDEDVYYIVSQLIKAFLPHRKDLLIPAEIVRDEKRRILGCRSLGT